MYKKNRQNLRKNKHKGRDIGAPWGRAQKMGSIGARQKMRNNNAPPQRGAKDGRQGGHERPFKQKMVGIGANPPIQKNGGQGRPPVVTPPSRKGLNEQQNIQQLEEVNVRKYREDGRRLFQGGQIGIKSDENDRALLGDGDYNDMFNDDDDDVHKPKKLLRNSIVIPPKGPPIKPPKKQPENPIVILPPPIKPPEKQPENPIVILPPPIKPPVLNIKLPKEPPINPSKKPTNSLLNLVIKKKIEVGKQQPYNDDNIVDYTDDNGDDYLDTSIERNDDLKKEKSEGRPPYVILGNIIYAQFKKESILTERTKNSHHIPVKLFLNSFESIKIYYLSGNGNDNKKIRDFLKSIFRMFNSVFKKNENIPENQSDSLNKIFNILLLICYCEQNFELSEDNELQKLKKDAKNELCNLANEFDNEKSAAKEETEKIGKNDTRTPLNFLERKNNDAKFNEKMKELDEGMENIIKKGKEKNPALNNVGKEFVDSKKKLKWSKKCFGLWEPLVKNNNAYNNSGAVNFLRYKLFAIEIGDDLPEEYKNMIVKNNTLTKDNKYLVSLPQFIALSVVLSENGRDKGEIIKDIIKNSSEALKYSEENEENIRQALSLLLAMYESLEPQKEEKSDVKDEILKTLADTLPQDKAKEITNFGNNDCLREGIEKESRENKEEIEEEEEENEEGEWEGEEEEEENEEGGKNENEKLNEIGLAIKESSKSSDKMNHDPNRLTK